MATRADMSAASIPGLVSIVIPCCGMLEYTKLCVPSVLKHSRPPFELIFIDIGSLDGTTEFLAGLQMGLSGLSSPSGNGIRIHVERTPTDLGLKDACRRALKETRGEYIVLLNNDCVVTNGWLNQLTGLASFSMGIGLAGPMSNMAAPPQLVEPVPYRSSADPGFGSSGDALVDTDAIDRFAAAFHQEHKGNWMHTERLGGFCLILKREVYEKIGRALDEWTDLSMFDTDILSAKAQQAGYTLAVCRDLFVHHFGTRTFAHGPPKVEHHAPSL
jgi:O-antigen biosynthesis protein